MYGRFLNSGKREVIFWKQLCFSFFVTSVDAVVYVEDQWQMSWDNYLLLIAESILLNTQSIMK